MICRERLSPIPEPSCFVVKNGTNLIGLGIQLNTDFQEKTAKPEQTKTLKEVITLPEFCYVDFATTIELPKFEIIINQTNTEL